MLRQRPRSVLTSLLFAAISAACSSSPSDEGGENAGALGWAPAEEPTLIAYGDVTLAAREAEQPERGLFAADEKEVVMVSKTAAGFEVNARDIDATTPARPLWKAPSIFSVSIDATHVYLLAGENQTGDRSIVAVPRSGGAPVTLQEGPALSNATRVEAAADDTIVIYGPGAPLRVTTKSPKAELREARGAISPNWRLLGKKIYILGVNTFDVFSLATKETKTLFGPAPKYKLEPDEIAADDSDDSFLIRGVEDLHDIRAKYNLVHVVERAHDGTLKETLEGISWWTPNDWKLEPRSACVVEDSHTRVSCLVMGAPPPEGEERLQPRIALDFPTGTPNRVTDVRTLPKRLVFVLNSGKVAGKKFP